MWTQRICTRELNPSSSREAIRGQVHFTEKAFDFSTPRLRDREVDDSKSIRLDQIQLVSLFVYHARFF